MQLDVKNLKITENLISANEQVIKIDHWLQQNKFMLQLAIRVDNIQVHFGAIETKALVDSGSVCTIIPKSLANAVVCGDENRHWVKIPTKHDLTI